MFRDFHVIEPYIRKQPLTTDHGFIIPKEIKILDRKRIQRLYE